VTLDFEDSLADTAHIVGRTRPPLEGREEQLRSRFVKLNQVVEHGRSVLDSTYRAISHAARRDMLRQLTSGAARISDLAAFHRMSFAAVSKHVKVLEDAGLVRRSVKGREHWLALEGSRLEPATSWLNSYRRFWESGLDRLEEKLRAATDERHR